MINIYNEYGVLLTDGRNPNLHLTKSTSFTGQSNGAVWREGIQQDLVFFRGSSAFGLGGNSSRISWWSTDGPINLDVFVYGSSAIKPQTGTAGLQMFNESGVKIFDSRAFPLRLREILFAGPIQGQTAGSDLLSWSPANGAPPSTNLSFANGGAYSMAACLFNPRVVQRFYNGTMQLFTENIVTAGDTVYTVFQLFMSATGVSDPNSWKVYGSPARLLIANVSGHPTSW